MKQLTYRGADPPAFPPPPPGGGRRPGVGPSDLRLIRLQVKPRLPAQAGRFWREFWDDQRWIPLKLVILAVLFLLAAVI